MKPTLVALAAGVGSRYGSLKQLEPVGPDGETLLEYSVFDAMRAGFARAVVVVRPETEQKFRQRFDTGMARSASVVYVHQRPSDLPPGFEPPTHRDKPWGTGQAILAAADEIEGPFAVVNADDFYGAAAFWQVAEFLQRPESDPARLEAAVVAFRVGPTLSGAGPVSRAICRIDGGGDLRKIFEITRLWKENGDGVYRDVDGTERRVGAEELASMNMWALPSAVLPELERRFAEFLTRFGEHEAREFYLPGVVQDLVAEGRMRVEVLAQKEGWCGITYPADREHATRTIAALVESGVYPRALWA